MRPLALLIAATLTMIPAAAAIYTPSPISLAEEDGGVVFAFAGGWATGIQAADVLESHGLRGTFFVSSGLLRLGPHYQAYLSPDEVMDLAARGHDVESMTVTQRDLTRLPSAAVSQELVESRDALTSLTGHRVQHLLYPYGAVDEGVSEATAASYASGSVLTLVPRLAASADPYQLPAVVITGETTLDDVKAYADAATAAGVTIVMVFHQITPDPGPFDWSPDDLDALAAHVVASGATVTTISQLVTGAPPPIITGPRGRIVFTFDDGSVTHLEAARMLEARGFRGTFYVISECSRSEVDTDLCMSDSQVQSLAAEGHAIESHTDRHRDLTRMKGKKLVEEILSPVSRLGLLAPEAPNHIAYPYGAHSARVRETVSLYYDTGRIFLSNPDPEQLPVLFAISGNDPMLVPGIGVTTDTTLARAMAYVDYAHTYDATVVLVFHDIVTPPADAYSWAPSDFDALVAYADGQDVAVVTMDEAYE